MRDVICEIDYAKGWEAARRRHARGERQVRCSLCCCWYWPMSPEDVAQHRHGAAEEGGTDE